MKNEKGGNFSFEKSLVSHESIPKLKNYGDAKRRTREGIQT